MILVWDFREESSGGWGEYSFLKSFNYVDSDEVTMFKFARF